MEKDNNPYIPHNKNIPELTGKVILFGVLLSVVLSAANAYLGLFAGMTVSASIPAAVMSMAIFKLFKRSTILENNAVQTAASAGESLAAGVIFTFPALVLMGYWETFNYFETMAIALCGGILGVLFTIPLRSVLIVKKKLRFPEGIATSEVLKSGEEKSSVTKFLLIGGIIGAVVKFTDSALKLWHSVVEYGVLAKNKLFVYFGMNLSPALIGVGYIVGFNISLLVFLGGVISWWVAIPLHIAWNDIGEATQAVDLGYDIWNTQIRYLGVGAMLVGGLWALVNLRQSISSAFKQGLTAFKQNKLSENIVRTDQDISMNYVITAIVFMIIPIFLIYLYETNILYISGIMAVFMVIAGFLFSSVAAYMAGLVGSSNNPISGVTIATILVTSLILLVFLGYESAKGPAAAIMIGAVVCCAAAIGGDNMQDLKSGYILGATPRKQQVMQIIGVVAAALVLPLTLQLLQQAYGFGPKTEAQPNSLAAPQATLMHSVTEGIFGKGLPWNMVFTGMGIAAVIIIIDKLLERRGASFRMPVLAVAVGLYLPFELDSAIMVGGLIALMGSKLSKGKRRQKGDAANKSGLLFASGLITGEALLGIILAIPIVLMQDPDFITVKSVGYGNWIGGMVVLCICYYLFRISKQK